MDTRRPDQADWRFEIDRKRPPPVRGEGRFSRREEVKRHIDTRIVDEGIHSAVGKDVAKELRRGVRIGQVGAIETGGGFTQPLPEGVCFGFGRGVV